MKITKEKFVVGDCFLCDSTPGWSLRVGKGEIPQRPPEQESKEIRDIRNKIAMEIVFHVLEDHTKYEIRSHLDEDYECELPGTIKPEESITKELLRKILWEAQENIELKRIESNITKKMEEVSDEINKLLTNTEYGRN